MRLEKETERNRELEEAVKGQGQVKGVGKKYSINVQVLHDKLYLMYEQYVDRLTAKRKQACLARMQELFANANR